MGHLYTSDTKIQYDCSNHFQVTGRVFIIGVKEVALLGDSRYVILQLRWENLGD